MSTRTIDNLTARLAELQGLIDTKRAALGVVLAEGGDTKALIAEIAQLEAEAGAIPAAIAHSKRKAAELAAFKAAEEAKAVEWAKGELTKAEVKAAKALAELGKQLDQIDAMRARIPAIVSPLFGYQFTQAARAELARLRGTNPELIGLPPKRTPQEERRLEYQARVDQAAARLAELESIKADRDHYMRNQVKSDMIDAANAELAKAKKALAELQ